MMNISEFSDAEIIQEGRLRAALQEKASGEEKYRKYKIAVKAHDAEYLALAQEIIPGLTASQFDALCGVFLDYQENAP